MNRRRLGATFLTFVASAAFRADQRVKVDDFDFARCVTDPAFASAVGTVCLRKYPEHSSRAVLLRFLQLPDESLTAAQITAALERRIRDDFAYQRTLVLERWLLSRTEAAVCGLIALR